MTASLSSWYSGLVMLFNSGRNWVSSENVNDMLKCTSSDQNNNSIMLRYLIRATPYQSSACRNFVCHISALTYLQCHNSACNNSTDIQYTRRQTVVSRCQFKLIPWTWSLLLIKKVIELCLSKATRGFKIKHLLANAYGSAKKSSLEG